MITRITNRLKRFMAPDEFTSLTLRKKFAERYDIDVGLYSYGCFDNTRIGRKTTIGRYCSIAPSAFIFRRNHGVNFIGLTPFFYNSSLGVVDQDTILSEPLVISDDVWLGHNSVILPSVTYIGRGSVVAAGAVVTSNIEPYSIVGGNPAKIIRMRFDEKTISKIESTAWWEMTPSDIRHEIAIREELYLGPDNYFKSCANF